jgi:hypothetical protein
MSEENTQIEGGQATDNVDGLIKKRDELLGKNSKLKETNEHLTGKIESMDSTLKAVSQLLGIEEGEDITEKAKSLLAQKEQEKFDAMSETEKLAHRLSSIEAQLTETTLAKEQAEKREMSLRIDDTIKESLASQGVKDPIQLSDALEIFKAKNSINGIDGKILTTTNGQFSVDELVGGILAERKYLISNPSRGGSGHKGGAPVQVSDVNQALKNGDTKRALGLMIQNNQ